MSALGYMRVHLDHGRALRCKSALGSWECTGMHFSVLGSLDCTGMDENALASRECIEMMGVHWDA